MSGYITGISGFAIEAMMAETHGFGDAWKEQSFTGLKAVSDITISGPFNDVAASGPHILWGNTSDLGAERSWKLYFAGTGSVANNARKFDALIKSYTVTPTRGELHQYQLVITPTGAVTTTT